MPTRPPTRYDIGETVLFHGGEGVLREISVYSSGDLYCTVAKDVSIYANEWDKAAAAWLSCLPLRFDEIDTRSIEFVQGSDLTSYDQCHFFAGIGGWPLALQIAGWPIDAPVWTGSCPCQPFSQAGKRKGTADERHLWPEFARLINECRPPTIFGEQVASKDGRNWLATLRTDLEAMGYAVGAADLCAASVGAPHIRQRLFWVAHRSGERLEGWPEQSAWNEQQATERSGDAVGLADTKRADVRDGRPQEVGGTTNRMQGTNRQRERIRADAGSGSSIVNDRLANTGRDRSDTRSGYADGMETQERGEQIIDDQPGSGMGNAESIGIRRRLRREPGEQEGNRRSLSSGSSHWSDIEFIPCRDGKARPVKPGVRLLAHGVSGRVAVVRSAQSGDAEIQKTHWYSRVAALKGFGNAIVPQVAAEFVAAFLETMQ